MWKKGNSPIWGKKIKFLQWKKINFPNQLIKNSPDGEMRNFPNWIIKNYPRISPDSENFPRPAVAPVAIFCRSVVLQLKVEKIQDDLADLELDKQTNQERFITLWKRKQPEQGGGGNTIHNRGTSTVARLASFPYASTCLISDSTCQLKYLYIRYHGLFFVNI